MHDDHHHHDHDPHGHHHHHGPNGHHHHSHPHGHNGPAGRAVQWQTPHLPADHEPRAPDRHADLDLVETAFIEGFARAPDATSFLRLSGIPFVGEDGEGRRLHLVRVEIADRADVGSVVPLLGGGGMRYDPLPERLVSRRRSLAFAYHDGAALRRLAFAEARALADRSEASRFDLPG